MVPCGYMDMDTENLLLIPTSEYIPHPNATYAHMPVEDWGDIQRDFATVFERRRTNVQVKNLCNSYFNYHPTAQFIVVPEVRRMRGRDPSKPCGEMDGPEFTKHVLENFDLDIVRHAIHASNYISCPGGLDTIVTFFDDEWYRFVFHLLKYR